jgi:ABC-type nitrate/sulfonate/bicarbonate transport system permease component
MSRNAPLPTAKSPAGVQSRTLERNVVRGARSSRAPGSSVPSSGRLSRVLQLNPLPAPLLSVVIFLSLWQIVGSGINPILLATPADVAIAFGAIVSNGSLMPAFLRAMEVLALGFGLSAIVGIAVGILMGRSSTANRVLSPYVAFFQATPLIGLVPLVVIWFGIGLEAEVAVTFLLAVWSIIINTSEGVRNTPETLLDMARIYHASERSVIRNIAVPHAIPYIFAGLRIALAKALIGVIIAEMDVSVKGLGGLITNFGDSFQTASLMAVLIASSMVGVIGTAVLEVLRRRIAPWATGARGVVEA